MKIFGREPVLWVGIIMAFIIAIVETALGQGLISDVLAGKIEDVAQSLASTTLVLLPIILNLFARAAVTPVAAPLLPVGTPVLIQGEDTDRASGVVEFKAPLTKRAA